MKQHGPLSDEKLTELKGMITANIRLQSRLGVNPCAEWSIEHMVALGCDLLSDAAEESDVDLLDPPFFNPDDLTKLTQHTAAEVIRLYWGEGFEA